MQGSRDSGHVDASGQGAHEVPSSTSHLAVQQPARQGMQPNPDGLATPRGEKTTGLGTDRSVVGQPFPVSESVNEACKPTKPGVFRWESCGEVSQLLAQMATEPRDEQWAVAKEEVLRAHTEKEPGRFTIRALECRKSICFVETASLFGVMRDPSYGYLKEHGLAARYPVFASETDASGALWTITLFPFVRR